MFNIQSPPLSFTYLSPCLSRPFYCQSVTTSLSPQVLDQVPPMIRLLILCVSIMWRTHVITRKRGKAQRDGRLLYGSVSPPIECYWLVNASPLNYGRWLDQNSGPIFNRLWTKVHQIKFACAGVCVVCNAVFRLTISCCVREIFAIKSRSCAKSLTILGRQISGGGEEGATQISDRML